MSKRVCIPISICWLAASGLGMAQTPKPAPAPPAPPAAAAAAPAPAPAAPAAAPAPFADGDWQALVDRAMDNVDMTAINEQVAKAQEDMLEAQEKMRTVDSDALNEAMEKAQEKMLEAQDQFGKGFGLGAGLGKGQAFALQQGIAPIAPTPPTPPLLPMRNFSLRGSNDSLYDRGQRDLDNHIYDQALDCFTEVVSRGGSRADGALYWKAYTLNKLGRRDEALAAIADLRKNFASSRWLDDAKALEIQVKQEAGQKVTPESQSDEELKLLALNGLVQSDPDRAYPILERLLKTAQSPRLKKNAIFVLAESSSPKYQQLLEQIARGGGNPDLQVTAIQ